MGRDDEWIRGDGWIRGDAAHHAEYGETTGGPGTGWTTVWGAGADEDAEDEDEADEDDWPEDDSLDGHWPDDDDDWLDDEPPEDEWLDGEPVAMPGGSLGPGPRYWKGWGHGGVPGFSTWMAVAVAVVAGVAGVAVGFFLSRSAPVVSAADRVSGSTPGASAPASAPASGPASGPASTGSGAGPQNLPGLPGSASGNGNGQLRILLTGRVLAVSPTSVTIGGAGPSVTAAVTSTTKLTGRVHGLGGVEVGDEIAAQISGTPSHLVIATLKDPAQ